jgi:hypothetical protein
VSVWAVVPCPLHVFSQNVMLLSWSRAVRKVHLLLFRAQEFAAHNILHARMIQLEAVSAPEYCLNILVAHHSNISVYVTCCNFIPVRAMKSCKGGKGRAAFLW